MTYQVHINDWKEEGRLVGLQQGEHKKAVETARGMLSYGMPKDKVAEIAGLSIAEVQELQNNFPKA